MPTFSYHCVARDGSYRDGHVGAASRDEATRQLESRGWTILELVAREPEPPAPVSRAEPVAVPLPPPRKSADDYDVRLPLRALTIFTVQLDVMLTAGFSYARALQVLTDSEDLETARVANILYDSVCSGFKMSAAMTRMSAAFSAFYVQMIRIGETSGNMGEVLHRLSALLRRQEDRANRIKSALTYPGFLFVACVCMLAFLIYWMLPGYVSVFSETGAPLPPVTKVLVAVTRSPLPGIVLGALIALPFLAWIGAALSPRASHHVGEALRRVPLVSAWLRADATASACRNLGTMMEAGVGVVDALQSLSGLDEVLSRLKNGATLAGAMEQSGLFPRFVGIWVASGVESGKVPQMLIRAAEMMEERQEDRLERGIRVLEPCMMMGMGLVVGLVVLAAFLPVFELVKVL